MYSAPHEIFCIIFTPTPEKWPLCSAIGHRQCIIFVVFQKIYLCIVRPPFFFIKPKDHKKNYYCTRIDTVFVLNALIISPPPLTLLYQQHSVIIYLGWLLCESKHKIDALFFIQTLNNICLSFYLTKSVKNQQNQNEAKCVAYN